MNVLLLELKTKEQGKTNEYMAKLIGVDPATYYRKRAGISEFTRREMQLIRGDLDLTSREFDEIFFADILT